MNTEEKLNAAVADYLSAKRDEELARERRYAAEKRIEALAESKDEGSKTTKTDRFSVTVRHGVTRQIDADKWAEIAPKIDPAIAANLVTWKPSLSTSGFRWIQDNAPDVFELVSRCITSKPSKVGITVKELE